MNTQDLNFRDKKIENYIHNRMSIIERHAFEAEMNFDLQLKQEVESLMELISLYDEELFELRKKLQATYSDLKDDDFFKEGNKNQTD